MRERSRVLRERHGYGGRAARIDYQQADPAVKKAEQWMKGFAKVGVLAADLRHARGEFGVDEGAQEGDDSSRDPRPQNQRGGVEQVRDDVGIDENSGADDAAHHDHGRVEEAELRGESGTGCGWRGRCFVFAGMGFVRHGWCGRMAPGATLNLASSGSRAARIYHSCADSPSARRKRLRARAQERIS